MYLGMAPCLMQYFIRNCEHASERIVAYIGEIYQKTMCHFTLFIIQYFPWTVGGRHVKCP